MILIHWYIGMPRRLFLGAESARKPIRWYECLLWGEVTSHGAEAAFRALGLL